MKLKSVDLLQEGQIIYDCNPVFGPTPVTVTLNGRCNLRKGIVSVKHLKKVCRQMMVSFKPLIKMPVYICEGYETTLEEAKDNCERGALELAGIII